ncbi:MAG TPA: LPXTG cell wall anchor domain-containing protein [Gaiellaceae bacterium]|jgi:LPXTG-motif cell wall-anchored protein|nr:LPXTG cell wall anchor domain-containing protein [Gaiellaceae bacterium]
MLNRRKAMLGWLVWTAAKPIAKRVMKRKARNAVPGTREGSRAPNTAAIVAGLGALGGALLFWRRRRAENGEPAPEA